MHGLANRLHGYNLHGYGVQRKISRACLEGAKLTGDHVQFSKVTANWHGECSSIHGLVIFY